MNQHMSREPGADGKAKTGASENSRMAASVFFESRRAALKTRRRVWKMAALAAMFSVFALYLAWLEAYAGAPHHNDESPLAEAAAQAAAPAANAAGPGPDLVRRGEY